MRIWFEIESGVQKMQGFLQNYCFVFFLFEIYIMVKIE